MGRYRPCAVPPLPPSLRRPMLVSLVAFLSLFARRFTPLAIMVRERTFIAVKPDGVQRGLTGEIIKRFEAKGFKLVGMKFMQVCVCMFAVLLTA